MYAIRSYSARLADHRASDAFAMSTPQQEVMQALGMDDKRKSFNWKWVALIVVVGASIYFQQPETLPAPRGSSTTNYIRSDVAYGVRHEDPR